jgi:hypothetical protein
MSLEKRFITSDQSEIRAYSEEDRMIIEGYASKYNVESEYLTEKGKRFKEILLPGAFRSVIENDVYLTFNHDWNKVFARTTNKTLELKDDDKGLWFRAVLNSTSGAKDLYIMLERGDVYANSFAFQLNNDGQEWKRLANGENVRLISRISRLVDISVVTHPAYPETEVNVVRGLDEFINDEPIPKLYKTDKYKRELDLLKLK